MNKEEIIEGNELIYAFELKKWYPVKAGFEHCSGFTYKDVYFDSKTECLEYCDKLNNHGNIEEYWFPKPRVKNFELRYNESWNWLMPVVEMIESFKYASIISHIPTLGYKCSFHTLGVSVSECRSKSKIEAVFKAVVQFIKWYNQNKKS